MRPIARYGFLGNVRKLLSQATFFIDAKEATVGQTASNLGTGGSVLDAQYGSTTGSDTNDPLLLEHDGTNYLYLPGVAGNYASTPDAAVLDITGDIDIRVRVAMDDWTPSAENVLAAKWRSNALGDSWYWLVLPTGVLRFVWMESGTSRTADSTVAVGLSDNAERWVRVTLDVDNAGQWQVVFYLSTDGTTWTQLGAVVNGATGPTSIFSGDSSLFVGTVRGDIYNAAGKFYRAQVLSGIGGTVVFDADFTTGITSGGQTTFTESSSNAATVTINRSTSGRKSVAVVRDVWLFGTDDYLEVADNDLLDFGASDSFTVVAVVRQWGTTTGAIIAKTSSLGATLQGWDTYFSTGSPRGQIGDGTRIDVGGPTATSGNLLTSTFVRNVGTDLLRVDLGATQGTAVTDTSTGSLANSEAVRIGRLSGLGTSYADMEVLAVAIFRRALSADEIASIANYYSAS